MTETHAPERNWAGTYTYRAEKLHRPTTMEQVQQIVANAASVHVLGSRHSFNDIADSSELLSLENLPADVVVDHEAHTVSCGGGVTYGTSGQDVERRGGGPAHARIASPHLRRRCRGDGDARLGRHLWQPCDRGRGAGDRDVQR